MSYKSTEDVYEVLTPFMTNLVADPVVGPKFQASNTSFRIVASDPDATVMLDCTQTPPKFTSGEEAAAAEPAVELAMSAENLHKFWLGKLNVPVALATRKVKVTGPVTALMGLLPALQPAYAKYKEHLAEIGRAED